MKNITSIATILVIVFSLVGCLSDSDSSSSDSGSSGSSGGSSGSSNYDAWGSNKTISFTCPAGDKNTITSASGGVCASQNEAYSKVFGCNDVNNFRSACTNMYSCLVNNSRGNYVGYYQQYLDSCRMY